MPDPEYEYSDTGARYRVVEKTLWPETMPIFNERGQVVGWANWFTMRAKLVPDDEPL